MLVHVSLGDGVGDTLVTQDISEPGEERWGVVVSNGGARAVVSASIAQLGQGKVRRANRGQPSDLPDELVHGAPRSSTVVLLMRKRYQPWVAARQ